MDKIDESHQTHSGLMRTGAVRVSCDRRSPYRSLAIFIGFILPFWIGYAIMLQQASGPDFAPFVGTNVARHPHGQSPSFAMMDTSTSRAATALPAAEKKLSRVRHLTTMVIISKPDMHHPIEGKKEAPIPEVVAMPPLRFRWPAREILPRRAARAGEPTPSAPPAVARVSEPHRKISPTRLVGVQLASTIAGYRIFQKYNQFFGGVAQPFKIGNDWNKDNALYADELLHFQGSYRLTQAVTELYRWAGVSQGRAELLGATIAASAMTFLEYVDGRRKDDEASYSDLTANFLGITFALLKPRVPLFRYIDFHISYRGLTDPLKKRKLLNYDRITHWLSVNLEPVVNVPVRAAVGYGVRHAFRKNARPKLFLGIGIGLGQLLKNRMLHLPGPFNWLDVYQVGVQFQVL
ncbi:MAG: DUF2279 domain-containing protein [candidate division KSB1 bacterium]|nr:DUF2279 domain-containing protein [candidate division KSB1 bacterium]